MTDSPIEGVADDGKTREAPDDLLPDENANKKTRMTLFDTAIQVILGPDSQVFTMHKGILCKESTYFYGALNNDFREARENKIFLPEDDADTFQIFQQWAYTGSFHGEGQTEDDVTTLSLIDLYIFAEARGIPKLQNQSIDAIIARQHKKFDFKYHSFTTVYDNTCQSSPLRKYFAEVCAARAGLRSAKWQDADIRSSLPHDFLYDLAMAFYDLKLAGINEQDFWANRQNYHVPLNTTQNTEKNSNDTASELGEKVESKSSELK